MKKAKSVDIKNKTAPIETKKTLVGQKRNRENSENSNCSTQKAETKRTKSNTKSNVENPEAETPKLK